MQLTKKIKASENGATVVEFALAAPVLILLLLGIIQIGFIFMCSSGLKHSVGEAARYATLWPRPAVADITTYMNQRTYWLDPENLSEPHISIATDAENQPYVEISASYSVPILLPIGVMSPIQLRETRRAYLQ